MSCRSPITVTFPHTAGVRVSEGGSCQQGNMAEVTLGRRNLQTPVFFFFLVLGPYSAMLSLTPGSALRFHSWWWLGGPKGMPTIRILPFVCSGWGHTQQISRGQFLVQCLRMVPFLMLRGMCVQITHAQLWNHILASVAIGVQLWRDGVCRRALR